MTHGLVVGGTRGLGRALVARWAREGRRVSVIGRQAPPEDRKISGARYWAVDLADPERLKAALREIVEQNGRLRHLVFYQRWRGEGDDWIGEFQTVLTATRIAIDTLADHFQEKEDNAIVVVNSSAGSHVLQDQPLSYHVAKAGLLQMVRYYAVQLGPRGIRVNSVSPCTVVKEESREFYMKNEKLQALYKQIVPLGRMGTAEDVAAVIDFLCSPSASYLTGQNLVVDGGLSLAYPEATARRLTQSR